MLDQVLIIQIKRYKYFQFINIILLLILYLIIISYNKLKHYNNSHKLYKIIIKYKINHL
jgi:hypothetical protein